MHSTRLTFIALAAGLLVASCGGGSDNNGFAFTPIAQLPPAPPAPPAPPPPAVAPPPAPEETRLQDARTSFAPADPSATTFTAMAAVDGGDAFDYAGTSRWSGMLGGAQYKVEVPKNWNGRLVMYAHGYAGEGNLLAANAPPIRRHLLQQGYAWAASSYSKNFYDVRAGVEDTNALALQFNAIAKAGGRELAAPDRVYITGHSMGGHITAAAIEDEAYATANHKVKYNGAVPMCGVVGDTELFDYFAAAQVAAQTLAGQATYPTPKWADIAIQVTGTLFSKFDTSAITPTSPLGMQYASVLQNLSGGKRPLFTQGLTVGASFTAVWGVFGSDGTVNGILNKSTLDTNRFTYKIDGDTAASDALNAAAQKLTAVADANRLRTDGLRWIPKANGEFKIPVVTLHTLGDLYVPFSMEQVYNKRVAAKGNSQWLVQRAIRGITHCDFTIKEQEEAFDDMVAWEQGGAKPAGDDVVTPATVANDLYGCTFTRNATGTDDSATVTAVRNQLKAGPLSCSPPI
ncbi:alpha/beta hydrolase [Variovorax sp. J22G73]|uniref:alpha/beta hydrolase family protein n=1 Tax=unclassified Variovorax TaxID=663243 RepID=UPI000D5F7849|nr:MULTISPECIES: alpha/beta hydrolase [unclassified Variovorax]MDM0006357.1 alpha/beta hydrolase [Variovorax sp. J22R203]MDM0097620.1 alpha/beta hydrolase [Variovorax sp. J22G73]